jgi:serine/threonine-protein kinase RsbW
MVKREISLQNDLGELKRLTAFMEEAATEWNLNFELLFQLNLVAEEAVSNIILHGLHDIRKMENILVELSFGQGELLMRITDHGLEFNPLTMPPPDDLDKSASERQIGGLGIYFIRQFMDNVEYYRENHCNVLILTKKVS